MKIDGKKISQKILDDLHPKIKLLKQKGISPTLAIILIGTNESSRSYIKQKQLKAAEIGAKIKLFEFEEITEEKIINLISKLNNDNGIHGIIVQRPLPNDIDRKKISVSVDIKKDVDGYNPKSSFNAPVALAVVEILKNINVGNLSNKKIAVIGKGETAGGPIITYFRNLGIEPQIIDSQSKNPDDLIKSADIIISAVGKENIIDPKLLNTDQILIGVGLISIDGRLKGDYTVKEIEGKVNYFTPTIGGVGPVNVAMLMKNLLSATSQ